MVMNFTQHQFEKMTPLCIRIRSIHNLYIALRVLTILNNLIFGWHIFLSVFYHLTLKHSHSFEVSTVKYIEELKETKLKFNCLTFLYLCAGILKGF